MNRLAPIHQALFGYSNGHHLLFSSTGISPHALKTIEPLSDLSGALLPDSFDGYLTGYYLPELSCYVLSKTWGAKEMPRLGCVWTHVLLIPDSITYHELRLIPLESVFVRPNINRENWENEYKSPLMFDEADYYESDKDLPYLPANAIEYDMLSKLLLPDDICLVFSDESETYSNAFLTLIKYFGISFFKDVSFCTGALSPRMINGSPFGIQIVPKTIAKNTWIASVRNQLAHGIGKVRFEEDNQNKVTIKEAVLFWQSNRIENRTLESFKTSVLIIDYYNNSTLLDFGDLFERVRKNLCDELSENGVEAIIAQQIFEKRFVEPNCFSNESLIAFCSFITETENWDSLITNAQIKHVIDKSLFGSSVFFSMLLKLLESDLNALGIRFLNQASKEIDEVTFSTLLKEYASRAITLIGINRNLALYECVWDQPYSIQCEVVNLLGRSYSSNSKSDNESRSFYQELLFIIIKNSKEDLADRLFKFFGIKSITAFFDYYFYQKENGLSPQFNMETVCKNDTVFCIERLCKTNEPVLFSHVIKLLDPYDIRLQLVPMESWISLYNLCCIDGSLEIKESYAQFILPCIIVSQYAFPNVLAQFAFQTVHSILAEDRMDYEEWENLSLILPEVSIYNSWDKCKRLRKAAKQKNYRISFDKP